MTNKSLYCSDCKQSLEMKYFYQPLKNETYGWCKVCRNKYEKEKRDLRIKKGVCVRCQKERPPNCLNYCEYHHIEALVIRNFGRSSKKEITDYLYQKLHTQKYICPYTGEKLVLGINAHVDHIYPKARFPELANNLNNLEWISKEANYAKRDLTREEFISFCKKVVIYSKSHD